MTETNGSNGSNGNGASVGTDRVKHGLAQMLKGGVIVRRLASWSVKQSEPRPRAVGLRGEVLHLDSCGLDHKYCLLQSDGMPMLAHADPCFSVSYLFYIFSTF